ncbi:M20 family metallopeptidase [Mesorhizobium sp. UC22_110]|uniref:M20 metallopeptidase family protein n=1 Tax=Mesorhizobium sp. UC22_110 TaxID=3374552 RepID=UPI003756D78C
MMRAPLTSFQSSAVEEATSIRRHLHSRPELKFEERETSDLVASFLVRHGYETRQGIAGTGVIGVLDTGRPGPTLCFRADMDALPIQEKTGLSYASTVPGKMHACGHDGHTASLLLAAAKLASESEQLGGRIKLLFQPAEEGGTGAARMIEEGALAGVDAIYGFHNRPGYRQGRVFAKAGPAMGGTSVYEVTIIGNGGHSSRPDLAVDPIFVGASLIHSMQSVVSRRLSPLESGVVSVTQFHGGNAHNIIPGRASMTINTRDASPETGAMIDRELNRLITSVCHAHGAESELTRILRIPPVVNDDVETEFTVAVAVDVVGPDNAGYVHQLPTMGAEDFAFYLEKVPGCFFFVGNGEDSAYLHHPLYDFNDDILPVAAGMFAGIAHRRLGLGARSRDG